MSLRLRQNRANAFRFRAFRQMRPFFLVGICIDFPRVLCYIKDGRSSASGMIFPRCFLKPDAFLERMIVMKKMRKLLAVLAAGVLALCSLSVSAFAETITIVGVDGEINTEPVYALGKDLSLYPKGDADLDGEVTVYDACLILCHFCRNICGLEDMLTSDQIEAAEVDGKSVAVQIDKTGYVYSVDGSLPTGNVPIISGLTFENPHPGIRLNTKLRPLLKQIGTILETETEL